MNTFETTRFVLVAVSKAFINYKNDFDINKSSDELFDVFLKTLDKELGEYEIVYDYIMGKESVNVDGKTTKYYPCPYDSIIMDISVKYNGVWCDVTRTFFVNGYTDKQKLAFEIIKESLDYEKKKLQVGITGHEMYMAANHIFNKYGLNLCHHAGHLISDIPVSIPEFILDEKNSIKDRDIVAIEAGIYDEFGIRLENDYYVTSDGVIDLFSDLMPLDDIKEYVL